MAKVTVISGVTEVEKKKKDGSGTYMKRTQDAIIETRTCKITTELDVPEGLTYAEGEYTVDMEAQLKPGRFGLEMPRWWKLTPLVAEVGAKAKAG